MEFLISSIEPVKRSVLPIPSLNTKSPVNIKPSSGNSYETLPLVWPGFVWTLIISLGSSEIENKSPVYSPTSNELPNSDLICSCGFLAKNSSSKLIYALPSKLDRPSE